MRTRSPADFLKLLNVNLAENPFYVKLFEVVGNIIDQQIGEPMSQLVRGRQSQHIRRGDYLKVDGVFGKVAHIKRVHDNEGTPLDEITIQLNNGQTLSTVRRALQDRRTLIDNSRLMGLDYYSDYLKDEDLARIGDYISYYWPKNGQPEFINFIGFVKSLSLDMHTLWTTDRGDNATSDDPEVSKYRELDQKTDDMKPVWEQGNWYPTSHVEITYDALISSTIDDDLILLFYTLAPIHLVLERISEAINIDLEYTLVPVVDLQFVDSGFVKINF